MINILSIRDCCFSPREGIWLLETPLPFQTKPRSEHVSVPVRGFGYWKLSFFLSLAGTLQVSVPVRGFGYWKHLIASDIVKVSTGFSPREGIWLLETGYQGRQSTVITCFSPREGIWLLETA